MIKKGKAHKHIGCQLLFHTVCRKGAHFNIMGKTDEETHKNYNDEKNSFCECFDGKTGPWQNFSFDICQVVEYQKNCKVVAKTVKCCDLAKRLPICEIFGSECE